MEIVSESTFQTVFLSHTLSKQEKKNTPLHPSDAKLGLQAIFICLDLAKALSWQTKSTT